MFLTDIAFPDTIQFSGSIVGNSPNSGQEAWLEWDVKCNKKKMSHHDQHCHSFIHCVQSANLVEMQRGGVIAVYYLWHQRKFKAYYSCICL